MELKFNNFIFKVSNLGNDSFVDEDSLVTKSSVCEKQTSLLGKWPPNIGEFVMTMFEDGYYPGEVLSVEKEEAVVTFLSPKVFTIYYIASTREGMGRVPLRGGC